MSYQPIENDGKPPEQHPAFWNRYAPPATNVAALVQRPAHQIDGYALAVAYMRDWRASKRRATC